MFFVDFRQSHTGAVPEDTGRGQRSSVHPVTRETPVVGVCVAAVGLGGSHGCCSPSSVLLPSALEAASERGPGSSPRTSLRLFAGRAFGCFALVSEAVENTRRCHGVRKNCRVTRPKLSPCVFS